MSASIEGFVLEMKHDPCFKEIFTDEDCSFSWYESTFVLGKKKQPQPTFMF